MHGLNDLGCRDCPGMRETPQQRCEAEKMIAMSVGDVNCGEVLAARDDPVQQSLRLLNCEKSVHEDSVSLAVDEGRRICHPHELFLAGWQITSKARAPYCEHIPAQAGVSGFSCSHHGLHDYLRKMPDASFSYGESCGADMRVGRGGRPNRPDARRTIGLRRPLPLETGRDRGRSVHRG